MHRLLPSYFRILSNCDKTLLVCFTNLTLVSFRERIASLLLCSWRSTLTKSRLFPFCYALDVTSCLWATACLRLWDMILLFGLINELEQNFIWFSMLRLSLVNCDVKFIIAIMCSLLPIYWFQFVVQKEAFLCYILRLWVLSSANPL